jgi:hypothetical protein
VGRGVLLVGCRIESRREVCGLGGNKLRCASLVEIRNDVDEVVRKSEEHKCPDQLAVVSGRESPFEIQVAKDDVFVMGVGIL